MSPLEIGRAAVDRRTLLAGVGAAAVAGSLTACGGGGSGSGTASGGSAAGYKPGSASLKVQLGKEISGVLYPDGYIGPKAREYAKFGDGTTEFRVVGRSQPKFDLPTNAFSKFLEEKTGVKVKYETVPMGADGQPKLNAMITSGDLPDAFMTGPMWMGGFTRSQIWAYGQQGMFLALDELVDQYAPEMLDMFKQYPDVRKSMTAPDGKMYMLPAVNQCYHCRSSDTRTWIYKPYADAVGMKGDGPDTIAEFEAMLKEIKAKYPNVAPISSEAKTSPLALIEAAYLNVGTNRLRRDGTKIVYTPLDDNYRKALILANKWVKDGLLDKLAWSQNADALKARCMAAGASQVAVVPGGSQGSFSTVTYTDPNARYRQFQPIKPFKGPDGKAYVPWTYDPGNVVGLIIPKKSKNPQMMVQWGDYQMSLMSTLNMRLGPTFWGWAAAGEKGIDGRQAVYKVAGTPPDNANWWEWSTYNLVMDVRHGESVNEATSIEPALYKAGKIYEPFATPKEQFVLTPFFTSAQSNQIGELETNITNAFKQQQAAMVLGNGMDPNNDADWQKYVSTIKAQGVDQYLDIIMKADAAQVK